ncbi:hypothetical protein HGRIS_002895 [Hohenbuehelia grisea]|uniref:DEAD/DEAH box helicase domain-containing protein n=1 Tax=Hohenbuehelia grisea TaxID=104357 RepID=A0ABR3JMT5_9AGAR
MPTTNGDDVDGATTSQPFKWSTPAGWELCQSILTDLRLGYEPHDFQIEGVCKSLDGVDLMAITPTGSGKTGFYVYHAARMAALNVKFMVINSDTREEAFRLRKEQLWESARTYPNIAIAGLEQLTSKDFEKALNDPGFYKRTCGVGFDEVHLLNSWGSSFRKDFQQMGFLKHRMQE